MSRFAERARTALLVVDVQEDVVQGAHERDAVVASIGGLVDRAREGGTPVVWVQHSDAAMPIQSPGWAIVGELVPAESEPVVHKRFGDSFEETELGELLTDLEVGRLVVVGAQTDACIRSTLHGALTRGYDTVLVSDAHTTEDMRAWGSPIGPEDAIAYTNLYWSFSRTANASGGVATAAEVDLGRGSSES
ncbi:MAG: isochorismatase family protein [Dermatophilaceae bacterium]